MSDSALWWYPGGSATLREIDFGEGLTSMAVRQVRAGAVAEGAIGRQTRVTYGEYFTLQLVLSNFDDLALYRELRSLESHLKAGYLVMFAEERAKAWAGFAGTGRPVLPGVTAIQTRSGNEWAALTSSTAALAADDVVCLQSGPPSSWREWSEVQSVAGVTITVDQVRYQHADTPVLLRHQRFFPALRFDGGLDDVVCTENTEGTYTLDLPLREDIDALQTLYDQRATSLAMWSTSRMAPGQTLDDLVATSPTRMRRHYVDPLAGR